MTRQDPKFRRIMPDARREILVDATLASLAAHGHDGVSVRRISALAGVSPGLINHHYASIDELVAHAYETLATRITAELMAEVEAAEPTPLARIRAFIAASFSPLVLDPSLLSVWMVFWSKLRHTPELYQIHKRTFGDYRKLLAQELSALAVSERLMGFQADDAATTLAAMLDGFWVMWCLDPAGLSPEKGIALCDGWIAGEIARHHKAQ